MARIAVEVYRYEETLVQTDAKLEEMAVEFESEAAHHKRQRWHVDTRTGTSAALKVARTKLYGQKKISLDLSLFVALRFEA